MKLTDARTRVAAGRWPERIALFWGFLLPIEYVLSIPNTVFDLPRYVIAGLLAVITPSTLTGVSRERVLRLCGGLLALAVIRTAMGLYHDDRPGITLGVVLLGSVFSCGAVALRPRLHRTVLLGFMLGVSVSAVVCLMQSMSIPTLRPPGPGAGRFPGLSTYTMLLTWQVLFGGLIAVYFLLHERRGTMRRNLATVALPLCAAALLVNGAQGGLLGLAAAGVAYLVWSGPKARRRLVTPRSLAVGAMGVVLLVLVLALGGLPISTFQNWIFQGNFVNEQARIDIAGTGWDVMVDNPLTGIGRQQFIDAYTITPHFLPLESAATAGLLAGLVAAGVVVYTWYLMIQRPSKGSYAIFGAVLLAAMCSNTLTEISGPFIGVSHLFLLLIAVVAAAGGNDPSPSVGEPVEVEGCPTSIA